MKIRIVVAFIVWAAAVAGIFAEKAVCGIIQTETYNGHTYYLLDGDTWWDGFEAQAIALGGHLATIDDQAENDFIYNTFGTTAQNIRTGKISLLIGLSDAASEGTFTWSDGAAVVYTNWADGQPEGNASDEDYVGIAINVPGLPAARWHDILSDNRGEDVVLGVAEVIPEPATLGLLAMGSLVLAIKKK